MERKNEKLIKAFAAVLKGRCKAAGITQEELAFRIDLSVSYISFLETQNRQPTLTVMAALAKQLGMSLAEFASEIEEEAKKGRRR